jgi:NifB/MoaA-like Fe-S oxidoreductase
VVVCPGVNDGAELERTLQDVVTLYPELVTVALVPVGVSDFTLEETMRSHTPEEAAVVIDLADKYQRLTKELFGRVSVYASDEFYLVAGRTPQPAGNFESLDQAENGIGLVAAFHESFAGHTDMDKLGTGFFQSVDGAPAIGYRAPRALASNNEEVAGDLAIITGEYAAPLLRELLDVNDFDDVKIITVENRYFGGNIKVAGLMTGQDLQRALAHVPATVTCLLPDVCLSEGRFLDGLGVEDLPHPVNIVRTTGQDLRAVLERSRSKGLVHS